MKKVLAAICVGLALLCGCNKSADIVIPTIVQLTTSQSAGDSIQLKLLQGVVLDGQTYNPDSIKWQVLKANGDTLLTYISSSNIFSFVTDDIGLYTVYATIFYDHNKKVTAVKQINVTMSAAFLQRKLIGSWTGTAQNYFGTTWSYRMTVDSINGHYLAILTSHNIPCVTWYGEGYDSIVTPLKRIVVNDINNSGRGSGYWYVYYGDSIGNGYAIPYNITELRFSNNYHQLDFEFFPETEHYSYTMTR